MNNADQEYFNLIKLVLDKGRVKKNRTGVDTIGTFGAQARFNLSEGFPLLTTKKVFFKGIVHELLWFLSGSTNIKYLVDNDVHIWDEWAYKRFKDTFKSKETKSCVYLTIPNEDCLDEEQTLLSQDKFIAAIKSNENFAQKWGELGEGTYGGMWREFPHYNHIEQGQGTMQQYSPVDQIQKVIDKLKTNPDDRRMIVSAWHPYWVDHCALPPCHCLFQFHTEELTEAERLNLWQKKFPLSNGVIPSYLPNLEGKDFKNRFDKDGVPSRRLNCQLYQRSCDLFLGVPFNIASYSLLLAMMAQVSNMVAGEFIHTYGDLHIYSNHFEQVKTQLSRQPKNAPKLFLNPEIKDLFKFKYEDIKVEHYDPHPAIKGEVAV